MQHIIDDASLAEAGEQRMHWFRARMPIITRLKAQFEAEQPFRGLVLAACFHIEPKTAYWMESMLAGGAEHIYLVGNLGTTRADTAAFLAAQPRMTVLGREADTLEDHQGYLAQVMGQKIDLFLDNGASLILAHHQHQPGWQPRGANEETRSGRLLIEKAGAVPAYPVVVVDDSPVKWMLENAVGVGQSVVDGFMRATSLLVGGKRVLIVGYGHCGVGVAAKFRGMGAATLVADTDPVALLRARAEGHSVGTLEALLPQADVVVTVTGRFDVLRPEHVALLRPGAILANAGHYGFEIDRKGLIAAADDCYDIKPGIEALRYGDKEIYLLEKASPLNLSAADGNPIEIMDLGLGLQASCARRIAQGAAGLAPGLQAVPRDIDEAISQMSLELA